MSYDNSIKVIEKAVVLAKKAVETYIHETRTAMQHVNRKLMVAGSCGPYGTYLHDGSKYTGFYGKILSRQELIKWYRPRVKALVNAGVNP